MPSPSPNGKNGRSVNGRFAIGNVGGPGNPLANRTGHIKRVLLDAVTDDDLRAIAKWLCIFKFRELSWHRLVAAESRWPKSAS